MNGSIDPKRLACSRRAPLLASILACGALVAGCGASAGSQTAAAVVGATTSASSSSAGSSFSASSGSSSASSTLAFSRCIRASGVPNFPDPKVTTRTGGNQVTDLSGINLQAPAVQAAVKACGGFNPKGP